MSMGTGAFNSSAADLLYSPVSQPPRAISFWPGTWAMQRGVSCRSLRVVDAAAQRKALPVPRTRGDEPANG